MRFEAPHANSFATASMTIARMPPRQARSSHL